MFKPNDTVKTPYGDGIIAKVNVTRDGDVYEVVTLAGVYKYLYSQLMQWNVKTKR